MAVLIQYANGAPGIRFDIDKKVFRIGRSLDNDLCIPDAFVSKAHAVIERRPSDRLDGSYEYVIRDLGSTNKTFVNDGQVEQARLCNEDVVRIGRNTFRFLVEPEDEKAVPRDLLESGTRSFSRRLRFGLG